MSPLVRRMRGIDPSGFGGISAFDLERRIQEFLTEYLRDRSVETVGTYRRSLNEFERWVADTGGRFQFTTESVEDYKRYLTEERRLSLASVSTYLTALRRLGHYLVEIGVLDENPAAAVKGNRRPSRHSRSVLTEEEVGALLDSLRGETQIETRDRAIIYLMLLGGLSEIEIVRADVQDLEQTLLGWYLKVQGKGRSRKDQQVPVDAPVMDKIRHYLSTRRRMRPEAPLFVSHGHRSEGQRLNTRSVRSRVNFYLKEARIRREGITPHSLTHTSAMIWLNDGMSLEEVRRRMRHGTVETTRIYLERLQEVDE